MPCYTIQQSHVEFLAKSTDLTLLTEALRKLGFEVSELDHRLVLRKRDPNGYFRSGSYDRTTGRLELDSAWDVNEIKRAYSERVVESQARKFGWQLEWSTNAPGHRQATVLRRG
jgi:hypothetical protein